MSRNRKDMRQKNIWLLTLLFNILFFPTIVWADSHANRSLQVVEDPCSQFHAALQTILAKSGGDPEVARAVMTVQAAFNKQAREMEELR